MKNGFSLMEFLAVMAVMAVVLILLVSVFSNFRSAGNLTTVELTALSMLRDARSRTLASEANNSYGVHFESAKIALFKGSLYNASDPSNEIYNVPGGITINSINLTGGATDVVFTRLYGTTTASGTITFQAASNSSSKTITIFSTGSVQ